MKHRKAKVRRITKETKVSIGVDLDGKGRYSISTSISFIDHMLELFSKHSGVDLNVKSQGDTEIDDHHLVEDIGITFGEALLKAIGNKKGINRYGEARIPMDESLSGAYVDLSGRPYLEFKVKFKKMYREKFDYDLIEDFFRAFSYSGKLTLHIIAYYGRSNHHISESVFKALAVAFKQAVSMNKKDGSLPSTKGAL
ncbi:MAG: imidazoleglycerol-phosphate dehydratase HisB [bacterium]